MENTIRDCGGIKVEEWMLKGADCQVLNVAKFYYGLGREPLPIYGFCKANNIKYWDVYKLKLKADTIIRKNFKLGKDNVEMKNGEADKKEIIIDGVKYVPENTNQVKVSSMEIIQLRTIGFKNDIGRQRLLTGLYFETERKFMPGEIISIVEGK